MKKIIIFSLLTLVACCIFSCKKNERATFPLSSLNVTNAVVGGASLTFNTSALTVVNNGFSQFTLGPGNNVVNLYPAGAPASPYYDQTISINSGDYYSLFLAGSSPSSVDNVLIKETYKNYTDSLCGVRFINLSPNSNPISINILGSANGSTVASLAYKAYSDFIQLPAKKVNSSYMFQIRDAATGNLITSYTLTTPYFNNVTIALRGLITAPGITLVKDY